jgi:phthiocerol/phenolphthiocerol synthesis type-I polyketide synthase D
LAAGQPALGVIGACDGPSLPGRVFVYSGQGSQWAGMGRQLLADEQAFGAAVAELEPMFLAQTGFSLLRVLAGGEPVTGIERIQPVLVGTQLALTALWRSYGVQPDAVIGHSMGEVTAAVVAGALTPAEGLHVIATRSRLMSRLSGQGAMALLELDPDATEALIGDHPEVTVAVYASPLATVVAGPPSQIDALIAQVVAENLLARRIEVDVASHHPIIDAILPELQAALAGVSPATPAIPIITTVDGADAATAFDARHWGANVRKPVRFSDAITTAGAGYGTFIEISPHPLLTHAITENLNNALVISTMNRDQDQTLFFQTQLAAAGVEPPGLAAGLLADIPSAPWHHASFWVADRSAVSELGTAHPLLGAHTELPSGRDHVWQADVGTDVCPWLADHVVGGQPILPAAAFAEIVMAAGSEAFGVPARAVVVTQLEVERMLALQGHTRIMTQLSRGADGAARVEVFSRSGNTGWRRQAVAQVVLSQGDSLPDRRPAIVESFGTEVSPADFYAALRRTGQHHGPAFAALTRIVRRPDGSSDTEITVPGEASRYPDFRIHPVMLDAALQSMAAAMPDRTVAEAADASYLPVSFESIRVFGQVGRHARCHTEVVDLDEAGAGKLGAVLLTDQAGNPTAEIAGIYLRRIERRALPLPLARKVFDTTWVPSPLTAAPADGATPAGSPASPGSPGSWLVLAGESEAAVLANEFATRWRSPARRVVAASLADEPAVRAAFADTGADAERPPAGVVIFLGGGATCPGDAVDRARDSVWLIASTVRAVLAGWHGRSPRLWLVTRKGLVVDGGEPGDPAAGALKGLIRVLAYEHPDLRATLVDLDAGEGALAELTAELGSSDSGDVIAWRSGVRYAERLSRADPGTPEHRPVVRDGAAYIVTGGLGGLGLVVARWLVDSGAGRVVLNGRSEPSDDQCTVLAELAGRAEISIVTGDIAEPGTAERLVATAEETARELRGVIHGAAVIDDSPLVAMSKESLERVWAPKAAGASRLHEASRTRNLDWWVGFSSAASLLGSPGQAAYASASAWLDALVRWRRATGLPATTINWGPWSEVGAGRSLADGVLDPITPAEGIEALEFLLATDRTTTGVARLRIDRALAVFPEVRGLGYFTPMVEESDMAGDDRDWAGAEALRGLVPHEARRVVTDRLCARTAAVMGYAGHAAVDRTQPLVEMGMDSLLAVRIRNTARADFGVEPPVALLLQGASLQDIATDLILQLGLAEHPEPQQSGRVRDRDQELAGARREAAMRRKRGQQR